MEIEVTMAEIETDVEDDLMSVYCSGTVRTTSKAYSFEALATRKWSRFNQKWLEAILLDLDMGATPMIRDATRIEIVSILTGLAEESVGAAS